MRPRPLALVLSLTLAALPAPSAAAQSMPSDSLEVLVVGSDGALYQLTYDQGTALLVDLGPADELSEAGAEADSFQIPVRSLENMVGSLSSYEAPNAIGIGFDEETLRLEFSQGLPIWSAAVTVLGLLAAGGLGVGLALTRQERRRRRVEAAARQRALHAREAERTRIARDLHDGPLQDVHALRLLTSAQADPAVGHEAGRIAKELRAIAEGLRPPALGRFGLAAALSAHANRVKDRHPAVAIGLDLDEDGVGESALPDVVRAALFRIAQEAITNAIEHGGASAVRIRLALPPRDGSAPGPIVLEVTDDGAGFTGPPPDLAALADSGHFGLVGMHERAEAIGGRLTLSADGIGGRGARVRAAVPDARASNGEPRRWPRRLRRTPA